MRIYGLLLVSLLGVTGHVALASEGDGRVPWTRMHQAPGGCTDSDPANDIYVAGTVMLPNSTGEVTQYFDECKGRYLRQYQCVSRAKVSAPQFSTCDYGCAAGACIQPTCTDHDAQQLSPVTQPSYAERTANGVVLEKKSDVCLPGAPQMVGEQVCLAAGTIVLTGQPCPKGTQCQLDPVGNAYCAGTAVGVFTCTDLNPTPDLTNNDGIMFTVGGNPPTIQKNMCLADVPPALQAALNAKVADPETVVIDMQCQDIDKNGVPDLPANPVPVNCPTNQVCSQGSCVAKATLDVCPGIEGVQTDFLLDTDNDGVNDACLPVGADFCSEPDPQALYPNSALYGYFGAWHLGTCVSAVNEPGQVLHVICGDNGKWTADITPCESMMPCSQGACVQCQDSDGGIVPEVAGVMTFIAMDLQNPVSSGTDYCVYDFDENTGLGSLLLNEYYCNGDTWGNVHIACLAGHSCIMDSKGKGSCQPSADMAVCTDSAGNATAAMAGDVVKFQLGKSITKKIDTCFGDTIIDYTCTANGNIQKKIMACPLGEVCQTDPTSQQLVCGPVSCVDSDGPGNFGTVGTVTITDMFGGETVVTDSCSGTSQFLIDTACSNFGSDYVKTQPCPTGTFCRIYDPNNTGTLVMGCTASCFDSDPNNGPETFGTVYDFANQPYPDVCQGASLLQFGCSADGQKIDIPATNCPNGCTNGACL